MSAWLCSSDHLDLLACAFVELNQTQFTQPRSELHRLEAYRSTVRNSTSGLPSDATTRAVAEAVKQILYTENLHSLRCRYGEREPAHPEAPEACEAYRVPHLSRRFDAGHMDNLKVLYGHVRCYGYQACESDDYEQSLAAQIMQSIRLGLLRVLLDSSGHWGDYKHQGEPTIVSLSDLMSSR
jgi:hypothetical protein